jgi:K+-transporting ATPase ATPase C chain
VRYFQPRPSQTGYSPAATYFNNAGPNNKDTRDLLAGNAKSYVDLEAKYNPGLKVDSVPIDAATGSASGVDPHISKANAAIQSKRVAAERGIDLATVQQLIKDNTDGRSLGIFGEPGVNVLKLNLALDKEVAQ